MSFHFSLQRTVFLVAMFILQSRSLAAPEASKDAAAEVVKVDVLVYGGTPSGVMAAIAAGRHGHSVALLDVNNHVGGVVSGGLVSSDMGDVKTIGGLAAEFFGRVVHHYHDTYGADSKQLAACHDGAKFEPSVAERIFDEMLAEQHTVRVYKRHRIRSIHLDKGHITSFIADDLTEGGTRTFEAAQFIDATYEGDLMTAANVPYRVGRESRAEFGEFLAGVNMGPKPLRGLGDHRTQSYNYRVSITSRTENRILCPKPDHYTPEPFAKSEGVAIKAGRIKSFLELYAGREKSAGPNDKFDSNWCDFIGNSEGYAEGDWTTRARIEARQRDYVLSRLYYLQNDSDLPEAFRADARKWGLPRDEFADNGHFPFQLYVREARRMVGRYVLRENDLTQDRYKPDGVCAGSYGIDCHMIQHILYEGKQVLEHTRHVSVDNYDIPYACLTPFEPDNLLVPVCLSATHVAYCSLRMEPVYMMLGHAAGDAAHLAQAEKSTVQKVDVGKLRELLLKEGAILDAGYMPPVKLTWTPAHAKPGEKVVFKAISGALQEPLKQIAWDFAGNGKVAAEGERAVHSFDLDKTYTVSLLAVDQAGRRRLVIAKVPIGTAAARDVTVDEFDADLFGRWNNAYPEIVLGRDSRIPDVFYGPGASYDVVRNGKTAPVRARFQPAIPQTGRYQLCIGFRPAKNQATNVPLTIHHAEGVAKTTVNERAETTPFNWTPVGEFRFKAGDSGYVELKNTDADGRVVIDGMRWVWLGSDRP